MKIETAYTAHVGGRDEQQDAVTVLSRARSGAHLVVLADGMGGHAGGSLASRTVVEVAERLWDEASDDDPPKALLGRIVQAAHEAINAAGSERGLAPRSTCVLLHVADGRATWAHVGDSRLYHIRRGAVAGRTRDHSVVQMLLDMGKISEQEMGTHPDQNRLTQSLGGDTDPEPDFGEAEIAAGDAFILCSDGLWEMVEPDEMVAATAEKSFAKQPGALAELAFSRAGRRSDNISLAMLRVAGAAAMAAAPSAPPYSAVAARPARSGGRRVALSFAVVAILAVAAAGAIVRPWEPDNPLSGIAPRDTTVTPAPSPAPSPTPGPAPDDAPKLEPENRHKLRPPPADPDRDARRTPTDPAPPRSTPPDSAPSDTVRPDPGPKAPATGPDAPRTPGDTADPPPDKKTPPAPSEPGDTEASPAPPEAPRRDAPPQADPPQADPGLAPRTSPEAPPPDASPQEPTPQEAIPRDAAPQDTAPPKASPPPTPETTQRDPASRPQPDAPQPDPPQPDASPPGGPPSDRRQTDDPNRDPE